MSTTSKILTIILAIALIVLGVSIYAAHMAGPVLIPVQPIASSTPVFAGPGERCGGNMTTARMCETGYHCAPEPGSHLPFGDVGGTCVIGQQ